MGNSQVTIDQITIEPVSYDTTWLTVFAACAVAFLLLALFFHKRKQRVERDENVGKTAVALFIRNTLLVAGGVSTFLLFATLFSAENVIDRHVRDQQVIALQEQLGLDHVVVTLNKGNNTVVARDTRHHPDGTYLSGTIVWVEDNTYLLVRDEH